MSHRQTFSMRELDELTDKVAQRAKAEGIKQGKAIQQPAHFNAGLIAGIGITLLVQIITIAVLQIGGWL